MLYDVIVLSQPCYDLFEKMAYIRSLQITAREAISSGPRSHFVNDEKIIY